MRGADLRSHLYAQSACLHIYDGIIQRARNISKIGHSVVVDATFLDLDDRKRATNITANNGIALYRFWLNAPPGILIDRVTA